MGAFEDRKLQAQNSWPGSRDSASEDRTPNAEKKCLSTKMVITALLIIEKQKAKTTKKKHLRNYLTEQSG